MITIFTICRPLKGHFDTIQRNAIGSWLHLRPRPEVFLFGADPSVARYAARKSLPFFPVSCDKWDIPLVSSAIHQARRLARYDILCLANADNLYLSDFMPAVRRVADKFDQFLIVGQRHNLDIRELIALDDGIWESDICWRLSRESESLHHGVAMDYLIWRGEWLGQVPPFAVGMTAYDPYIAWKALDAGVPTVDITRAVTIVHQAHKTKYDWQKLDVQRKANLDLFLAAGARRTTTGHAKYEMSADGSIRRRGKK